LKLSEAVPHGYDVSVKRVLWACAALATLTMPAFAAEPRWTMVRTPSVTVIGDQSAKTLRDVAIQIEQFRAIVGRLIANADRPLSLPTIVFVFGQRKSMQPFVPLFNGKPIELGGYFQGGADANMMLLSLEGFEEAASIVYHEYTHLLMASAVRSVPTWLNEGLAEYYRGYRLDADGKGALIGQPLPHHVLLLRERYMPLAELIAVDHSSPLYNEGSKRSIFYAESWALTHYAMTEMPNGAAAINRYTMASAEGQAPIDAFRDAFGATPAEFDKQLRTYVNRSLFGARRFELKDRVAAVTPGPPRTMTAGEANAWLGDLQRRVRRETEAAARIEAAVTADPGAPIVHAALGLLRLSEKREDEGIDALQRAAQMAPDDFLMQFLHGVWLLRVNESPSSATVGTAIGALKRAVTLNPDSADAYGWLAYAQMLSEASLPEARVSIERAMQLAPGRIEYRLRWADIRIQQGGYDEAKALLAQIAAVKIDPDAAAGARLRLERVATFEQAVAARKAARLEAETASRNRTDPPPSSPNRSRSIEVPSADAPKAPDTDVAFRLRKVGPGEARAYGRLIRIDCTPDEVRFHIRSDDRTVTAAAKRMEDVVLTEFLNDKDFTVSCGSRMVPDTVYLTWRRDQTPVAGRVGIAVSLEFLPRGYVP
jgi:tetratricopeptide (TPR) repeat protein